MASRAMLPFASVVAGVVQHASGNWFHRLPPHGSVTWTEKQELWQCSLLPMMAHHCHWDFLPMQQRFGMLNRHCPCDTPLILIGKKQHVIIVTLLLSLSAPQNSLQQEGHGLSHGLHELNIIIISILELSSQLWETRIRVMPQSA